MSHLQQVRDAIKRSRDLLAKPMPDAFAGGKTQEPFPVDDGDDRD